MAMDHAYDAETVELKNGTVYYSGGYEGRDMRERILETRVQMRETYLIGL